MAKGSAMGLWKGKKGSTVFYQIANSNSLQKQGMRERNYEPSNPQSSGQAGQRMRMYPAQAVYGVLKDTIERSWQGVKYGQMTRQAYLKSALRSELYPAVSKGDGVIVPGSYQIAKGSLGEVKASLTEAGRANIGFNFVTSGNQEMPVGDLSVALLEANTMLREGDQITVVLCYTRNSDIVEFNWWVGSIYIDKANDTSIEESGFFPPGLEFHWDGNGLVYTPVNDEYIYAAACIVSREGTTPMRSNATLAVNASALPEYYNVEARARARRSYMKPVTIQSTDWPVDPGGQGGGSGGDDYTITVDQVTIKAGGTEDPTPGGTVSGGGSYLIGERVTLTATPDAAHDFAGWFPTKADALANTNRISTAAIFMFVAGDQYEDVTTFYGKFAQQL